MVEEPYGVAAGGPVLAIFAHPDDTEFVCGGALALWSAAGRRLVYAFCTDGSKGSSDPTMDGTTLVATRQQEQRDAARVLGCEEVVFLPYPDAMLEPSLDLRRDLTRLIRTYQPETVVCFDPSVYWMSDFYLQHPDHRASGDAALAAVFPSARDRLTFPELLEEGLQPHNVDEVFLASPGDGHANRWIDITTVIDKKIEAICRHKSQLGDPKRIEAMFRYIARMTGQEQGLAYAEAYRRINLRARAFPGIGTPTPRRRSGVDGDTFRALIVSSDGESAIEEHVLASGLPDGDVEVKIAYSSLNYKDALAVTGRGKVVRSYPMVPGIDLAGIVTKSDSPKWQAGDRVIATGAGLGEERWGGFAERARVDSRWLVRLPEKLDLQSSMALGTAGLTAMLSLMACEEHGLRPSEHPVVVTGASGGLGSLAVAILARSGYSVIASTGRPEHRDYLTGLGAVDVIDRALLSTASERPLERGRWAAAVDSVGGATLAGLLRSMRPSGTVASCGMAGGHELTTTVFPFILRGVALLGIDSDWCPLARREMAWRRLSVIVDASLLDQVALIATVDDVPMLSTQILDGQIRGRVVIDMHGDHAADQ